MLKGSIGIRVWIDERKDRGEYGLMKGSIGIRVWIDERKDRESMD